jgi:hypothetical protein
MFFEVINGLKIMPLHKLVWSALLLMLCSCTGRHSFFTEKNAPRHFSDFADIAELMEKNSDSSLSALVLMRQSNDLNTFTLPDRNEFKLLFNEATFKNRKPTSTSFNLEPVTYFYDSLFRLYPDDPDLLLLRAKSYYYLATSYHERKDDVGAVKHYLNAMQIMQKGIALRNDEQKTRFMALVNTRMGEILYANEILTSSMASFRKAENYFAQIGDSSSMASMARNIGRIHQVNKEYEKALSMFKEAEVLNPEAANPILLSHSMGGIFYSLRQYDSAARYLEVAFQYDDCLGRIDAAAKLAEVYHRQGNEAKEAAYTRYYVENSIKEANKSSARKMEIAYLYDDYLSKATTLFAKEAPLVENRQAIVLVLLSFVFLLLCLAYVIVRNRRRISTIERHISTIELKHQKKSEGKDKEIIEVTNKMQHTCHELETNHIHFDFNEQWRLFMSSDIFLKINKMIEGKDIMIKNVGLYPKLKLSEVHFIELVSTVNELFDGFSSRLLKEYSDLVTGDVRHCCLGLMGLNDAEIAVLEGISYSGSNRKTNKILNVMQSKDSLEQTVLLFIKGYLE